MPETHASITPRCPACGSDAVVPDVVVYVPNAGAPTLYAGVYTTPDARFKKGLVSTPTHNRACSDCGYLMSFADDPRVLWDAHVDRLANDLD